jgi:hypothetical protein
MHTKDIDKLINWGELSRQLAGSRSVVTKNRMPKKHEDKVNELRAKVKEWLDSLRP